jgi:hypothetical protein
MEDVLLLIRLIVKGLVSRFSYGPGVADGNFNLQGSGAGTIEVYENGSTAPVKTLNIQLN